MERVHGSGLIRVFVALGEMCEGPRLSQRDSSGWIQMPAPQSRCSAKTRRSFTHRSGSRREASATFMSAAPAFSSNG